MKVFFTLVVLMSICISALWGDPAKGNQDRKAQMPSKIAPNTVPKDTLFQNTITINGKENVVSINNTNILGSNGNIAQKKNTSTNTIDINGEANSVDIHQNGNNGSVNINQTGNGNHVNVNQSTLKY